MPFKHHAGATHDFTFGYCNWARAAGAQHLVWHARAAAQVLHRAHTYEIGRYGSVTGWLRHLHDIIMKINFIDLPTAAQACRLKQSACCCSCGAPDKLELVACSQVAA